MDPERVKQLEKLRASKREEYAKYSDSRLAEIQRSLEAQEKMILDRHNELSVQMQALKEVMDERTKQS